MNKVLLLFLLNLELFKENIDKYIKNNYNFSFTIVEWVYTIVIFCFKIVNYRRIFLDKYVVIYKNKMGRFYRLEVIRNFCKIKS